MHTTYPLCGWIRSKASKCGAKPVGGCSIGAGGAGVDLTFLDSRDSWESYSRWLHSPGATSCERTRPNPGKQDGAMAASLVLSRPVSRCQSAGLRLAAIRVGTGVQPLQGENYTYSRVLGHVHSYSSVATIS